MYQIILKYWNIGLVIILVLGLGLIKINSVTDDFNSNSSTAVPQEGFPAPDFTLETIDGEMVTLSDLHGRAVLINFWTSWCPPCRSEMPALEKVFNDYQAHGFTILAVNSTIQDQKSSAINFANQYGLTFPILFDDTGKATSDYMIEALPTSFFINRDGIIQEIVIGGPMPEALLRERIEKLLKE